jgi:hypothetical protein
MICKKSTDTPFSAVRCPGLGPQQKRRGLGSSNSYILTLSPSLPKDDRTLKRHGLIESHISKYRPFQSSGFLYPRRAFTTFILFIPTSLGASLFARRRVEREIYNFSDFCRCIGGKEICP